MSCYTHSKNVDGEQETVTHHLTRAGERCAQFRASLGYGDWEELLGETHNFGK